MAAGHCPGAAVNSANGGNNWLVHANTVDSAETAGGIFRIQKQSVTAQASNALEIANISTGKAWLVVDIAGVETTTTASTPSERMRFAFMDNDPASTGGSTVTAEMDIDRSGAGLALRGEAIGTGSTNPLGSSYTLPLDGTNPITIVLELDKNLNKYNVLYKDAQIPGVRWVRVILASVAPVLFVTVDRFGSHLRARLGTSGRFSTSTAFTLPMLIQFPSRQVSR